MALQEISYEEARPQMQPGDVIAFSGKSHFSELIKFATRANISHVGTILQTQVKEDTTGRFFNQIIESTGSNGVGVFRFSDRINIYDGEIWWLPLDDALRQEKFDSVSFYKFLFIFN